MTPVNTPSIRTTSASEIKIFATKFHQPEISPTAFLWVCNVHRGNTFSLPFKKFCLTIRMSRIPLCAPLECRQRFQLSFNKLCNTLYAKHIHNENTMKTNTYVRSVQQTYYCATPNKYKLDVVFVRKQNLRLQTPTAIAQSRWINGYIFRRVNGILFILAKYIHALVARSVRERPAFWLK